MIMRGGTQSIWSVLAVAFLLSCSNNAQASGPRNQLELQPSGKWQLNYDEDGCKAYRQFGSAGDAVDLMLLRTAPDDNLQITLSGLQLDSALSPIDLPFYFGANSAKQVPSYMAMAGKIGTLPTVVLTARIDNSKEGNSRNFSRALVVTPEQEAAVSSVTFRSPAGRWILLRTGSLQGIMAAMRNCTDDFVKSWGYDPVVERSLQRPATPRGQFEYWVRSSDYPMAMLDRGQMAMVLFRLDVDEAGNVGGCHIIRATMPKAASETTCRALTMRGRFDPALDASGKPVKSYFASTVRFVISR